MEDGKWLMLPAGLSADKAGKMENKFFLNFEFCLLN